jgi:hypothetical protein
MRIMKNPDNLHDSLNHLHKLLAHIAGDAENLMEASTVNPNHLEPIKNAALDAHLLVTWIKDNIKEMHK